jgi:CO dehydrogenase maturation factor
MTKIITLSGKGGVGKTSISALIVRALRDNPSNRILAIDGDPAVGFSTALGVEVSKTLDQIRMDIVKTGKKETRATLLNRLDYELTGALSEEQGFAFLAIGRPEGKGCYCAINEFLKQLIADLAPSFDYVVIDGEAGVEQINRRVMERVTHLLLVSDASKKGVHVAKTIYNVAQESIQYEKTGLLFNRIKSPRDMDSADTAPLPVLGALPESEHIRAADIQGTSLLDIREDEAVRRFGHILSVFLEDMDNGSQEL